MNAKYESALKCAESFAMYLKKIVDEQYHRAPDETTRAQALQNLCEVLYYLFPYDTDNEDVRKVHAFIMGLGHALKQFIQGEKLYLDEAVVLNRLGFKIRSKDLKED